MVSFCFLVVSDINYGFTVLDCVCVCAVGLAYAEEWLRE